MAGVALRPAHETKHVPLLDHPFRDRVFHLTQLDNGATNGTGLWLGAQCLSLFLSDALKSKNSPTALAGACRPRAIELGSGIGLSACVLIAALRSTIHRRFCSFCRPVSLHTASLSRLWAGM